MKNIAIILSCLSFVYQLVTTEIDQTLLVHTSYGSIHGKLMTSRNGRNFAAFLGIPYARPPSGELRFMPPQPPQKWNGVKDATVEGNACIQRVLNGSEDCLYLNVFTHRTINEQYDNKTVFPVMVYIHGGGFYVGSSSLSMYGPEYLMDRNIVLVTLQYRLGVFGFLSTEDTIIPGNMGLKDQVKALQWIQENIHLFSGDRLKVTIFGNSAGSSSVHLHMMSPVSKDLFAKAISQSGTALSAFALIGKNTSQSLTHNLARHLNCNTTTSESILQCLQNKDSLVIQEEYSKLQDGPYEIKKVLFRPVVEEPTEHAFMTSSPLKMVTDKPWLVGLTQNEGLFKIKMAHFNKTRNLINTEFSQFVPSILFFDDTCSNPAKTAERIHDYYFKNASTINETIRALEEVISDSWFIWPTMQAIQNHNGKLYCYLLQHISEHSFTEIIGGPKGFGVCHQDELQLLFPLRKLFLGTLNEVDTTISKFLIDLWVNFAEETNPTPKSIIDNPQKKVGGEIIWAPSTKKSDPKFFVIDTNQLLMKNNVFLDRMSLWRQLPIRDKLTC